MENKAATCELDRILARIHQRQTSPKMIALREKMDKAIAEVEAAVDRAERKAGGA